MLTESECGPAAWFAVFGEEHRVAMLFAMARGEKALKELATAAEVETTNAQFHLKKLMAAGLVTARPDGKRMCYALAGATRTASALEFTHPSGLRAVLTLPADLGMKSAVPAKSDRTEAAGSPNTA